MIQIHIEKAQVVVSGRDNLWAVNVNNLELPDITGFTVFRNLALERWYHG